MYETAKLIRALPYLVQPSRTIIKSSRTIYYNWLQTKQMAISFWNCDTKVARATQQYASSPVRLFKPKYWLDHPENYSLLVSNNICKGSKYPKKELICFFKSFTVRHVEKLYSSFNQNIVFEHNIWILRLIKSEYDVCRAVNTYRSNVDIK